MFIVSQNKDSSYNVDAITQIVAVSPRSDDKDHRPLVIAIIDNREEVLARYETVSNCKTAIDFVSFLINSKSAAINMPQQSDIAMIGKKVVENTFVGKDAKKPPAPEAADKIVKAVLKSIFDGGELK